MIRVGTGEDVAAVEAMLRDARLVLDGVRALGDGLLVAEEHQEIVGAVGIEEHDGHALLRSLVVAPGHRGSGLGDRLTSAAVELARDRGLQTIYLLTETAEPFFAVRGFTRIAREDAPAPIAATSEFSCHCPASAAFMRREVA